MVQKNEKTRFQILKENVEDMAAVADECGANGWTIGFLSDMAAKTTYYTEGQADKIEEIYEEFLEKDWL